MNQRRFIRSGLLALSFLMTTAAGFAQQPNPKSAKAPAEPEARRQGIRMPEIRKQLNLTPEQAKKWAEIDASHTPVRRELFQESAKKREAILDELAKPNIDMAKINALKAEALTNDGKALEEFVKFHLKLKEILTPEQFKKFRALNQRPGPRNP